METCDMCVRILELGSKSVGDLGGDGVSWEGLWSLGSREKVRET